MIAVTVTAVVLLSACGKAVADPAEQSTGTEVQSTEITPGRAETGEASQDGGSDGAAAETDALDTAAQETAGDTDTQGTENSGNSGPAEGVPEDGVYSAVFDTDNSMFHVNETCEGRGTLTVVDGTMTMHIVMPTKNIVNLYYGLAEDAQKDGAVLIEPSVESVTYPDGLTEEVYAFDFPVPYLDATFDLALVGTKGTWYDHKVSVSDPLPQGESTPSTFSDGVYLMGVSLEGGSGRSTITSPAELTASGGELTLKIEWSSPNYDYMIVDGTRYEPVNTEGNSVFMIPVKDISKPLEVVADTVAMSEPHEIEYTIRFTDEQ